MKRIGDGLEFLELVLDSERNESAPISSPADQLRVIYENKPD